MIQFISYSIAVFLLVIILLVIILLVAKKYLSPSGNVNITVNGDKVLNVPQGNNLMAALCLRWQGQLRTVQGAGPGRRRRDSRL